MKKSGSSCFPKPKATPSGSVFTLCLVCLRGILLFLLLPGSSLAFYVGPEVGNAPGETKSVKVRGGLRNATSLAEAAYVPYINGVGNGVIEFLRSFVPALQPKVDFLAEQIQDTIDTANTKLMQKLENSNNGIIAVENFFTGLMKAVVLGKGPEDEERRRRLAVALIKSGMIKNIDINTTTKRSTSTAVLPMAPTEATFEKITGLEGTTMRNPIKRSSSTSTTIAIPLQSEEGDGDGGRIDENLVVETTTENLVVETTTENQPKVMVMMKDNNFNKMKVMKIVSNLL
ncbi:unnamed protein product [Orchesella dallaii]|uniref:Uncharacterized protein n=1 Tax=Orchesella dallaii TaxID=48710 RepID=A0ABP1QMJ3_9HEXA